MNAEMEFVLGLGFVCFIGLAVVFVIATRKKRKHKELYGFKTPGWSVVKDDQQLWNIELLFTQGLVSKVMFKTGYEMTDFHSNLKREGKEYYTGLISLQKYHVVTGFDSNFDLDYGWVMAGQKTFRYFTANLNKQVPAFLHANSTTLGPNLPAHFKNISDELDQLEKLLGFKTWDIIAHGNELAVMSGEIFDEGSLKKFLEMCEGVVRKIEGN